MKLSESYRARLAELAGLINENLSVSAIEVVQPSTQRKIDMSGAVRTEYRGYSLLTKEVAPDNYLTLGEDSEGNRIVTESLPEDDMMSMEKAQALIDKSKSRSRTES